jgi:NAD(P)-dependent dehydrogenase (short-subunit alcohol dehydrogenase family)
MRRIVLVTGGSRGIGRAVCRLAAARGYDVAVNYQGRAEAAEAVAAEVRAAGGRALTVQADVADPIAVERMFDTVAGGLGQLDALVNNAGIINRAAPLAEMPIETIQSVIRVDLLGAFWCAREAARRMARSRGGKGGVIVNMSSMAAVFAGAGGFLPYGAAKAGVDALTEGLGKEVAGDGVRVCGLRPGLIATEIQDDTGIPGRLEKLGPSVPIGRVGQPEEVAEAVLWLLSDAASYVTATSFNVSGGR